MDDEMMSRQDSAAPEDAAEEELLTEQAAAAEDADAGTEAAAETDALPEDEALPEDDAEPEADADADAESLADDDDFDLEAELGLKDDAEPEDAADSAELPEDDAPEFPEDDAADIPAEKGITAAGTADAIKNKASDLAGKLKKKAGQLSDDLKKSSDKKKKAKAAKAKQNARTVEEELADLAEEEKRFDEWGRPIRKKRRRRKKSRKLSCTLVLLTLILAMSSVLAVAILAVAKEMYGIDKDVQDRIITIEDTKELRCTAENCVALTTTDSVDMDSLLKKTLRLSPNRIVVGEVRSREALTLIDAWSTGHRGGCSTVHSDSAQETLYRLEGMISRVSVNPQQAAIARAINVIVYIAKRAATRRVEEVIAVDRWDPIAEEYVTHRLDA